MNTADWIAITLIAFAVFCAMFFMIKKKKNGKGCSGCPYSSKCSHECSMDKNERSGG